MQSKKRAQLRLVAESWCWPGGGVRQEDPVPAPGLGHVLAGDGPGKEVMESGPSEGGFSCALPNPRPG